MAETVVIAAAPLDSPDAVALIAQLNAELTSLYPDPADRHFELTGDQVRYGDGVFLIARSGIEAVGCGALRRLGFSTGEIKRMYVAPAARGNGVGRRLLDQLEEEARRIGLSRVVLETGTRQADAIRLYERAGFSRIPCFGKYTDSGVSVCMEKALPA